MNPEAIKEDKEARYCFCKRCHIFYRGTTESCPLCSCRALVRSFAKALPEPRPERTFTFETLNTSEDKL